MLDFLKRLIAREIKARNIDPDAVIEVTGQTRAVLRGADGRIKEQREWKTNLVVTNGKNWVANYLNNGAPPANMGWMGIGTGSVAAAAGDAALGTEAARVALTRSVPSGSTARYWASFGAGTGTGAITEAGIFNASSVGTLLARQVFSVINKGANDTLEITWDVTFS